MRKLIPILLFVLMLPLSAQAQLDHPDLLDIWNTSTWFSSTAPKGASVNSATVYQNEYGNSAHGHVGSSPSGTWISAFWVLYEPDTVKRSHKRGRLDQTSYAAFGVSTWNTSNASSTWDSTILDDCKASTVVNGTGGVPTDAKWKASCKGVLAALSLPQYQLDLLTDLLSKYVNVKKDKISISGKGPIVSP